METNEAASESGNGKHSDWEEAARQLLDWQLAEQADEIAEAFRKTRTVVAMGEELGPADVRRLRDQLEIAQDLVRIVAIAAEGEEPLPDVAEMIGEERLKELGNER